LKILFFTGILTVLGKQTGLWKWYERDGDVVEESYQ